MLTQLLISYAGWTVGNLIGYSIFVVGLHMGHGRESLISVAVFGLFFIPVWVLYINRKGK
jgi:hypothetical protein